AREMNFQYGHKPEATRMPLVLRQFTRIAGANKHSLVLGGSAALFLLIVAAEMVAPANVVGAYGFVLPILLVATARNRRLMLLTFVLCVVATCTGLVRPSQAARMVYGGTYWRPFVDEIKRF